MLPFPAHFAITQRASSTKLGGLPCISRPVRKILPAVQTMAIAVRVVRTTLLMQGKPSSFVRANDLPGRRGQPAGPAQPHEHEPVERAPRHPQAKAVNRDDAAEPLGDTLDRNRSAHGMTPVEIQGPRSRRPHGRQVAPASGFARNCRLLHVRRERTASENSTHPTQNMPWRPALAPRCPAELGCQPWHTNLIAVIT